MQSEKVLERVRAVCCRGVVSLASTLFSSIMLESCSAIKVLCEVLLLYVWYIGTFLAVCYCVQKEVVRGERMEHDECVGY